MAASTVAPFISMIDQAIFSNASGKESMGRSIRNSFKALITSPLKYTQRPAFRWILFVYGGTYVVANTVQTYCNREHIPWQIPKFIGSAFANVSLSVLKDRAFSRMFGTSAPRSVPPATLLLFATRDSMTIAGSFNLPSKVASDYLQPRWGMNESSALTAAQLVIPCAVQIFSTPLHLLGSDLYNNPANTSGQRVAFIAREYAKTCAARCGRIFPAFSIGGVTNTALRKQSNRMLTNLSS